MVLSVQNLDKKQTLKSIDMSRTKGQRSNDFLEISGVSKSNIKNLSPDHQKQVDNFFGSGKGVLVLRRL